LGLKITRIKLVTFSDGSPAFRAAGRRLVNQADSTGWFDHPSEHWTFETLRTKVPDFYFKHHKFIREHQKGFGFWIWKPAILSYLLHHLEDDEIVLYLDSGCQLNSNEQSKLRFQQYIEICRDRDLLVMQLSDDLTDAEWTKNSTLEALDPHKVFRDTNQVQATLMFAIKSEKSQQIAKKWLNHCTESKYSLLVDPSSSDYQTSEFKDHRHDQSIFSLVVKSEGIVPINDETWFSPNWEKGLNFPIWAMRNRTGGDVFRRNFLDLFKIFLAKVEHRITLLYRN
jgi:hypothetical protein